MRKHNSLLNGIATALAIIFIVGLLFVSIPTPVVSHSQYATASGTRQVVKRLPYKHKELRCIDGVYRLVTVSEGYTSKVVEESYSYTYEVEHEHPIWDRISQTAEAVGEILDCLPWPW